MTEPEYRAANAVNWSSLKYLRDGSPLHYRYALANPRKDTPVLAWIAAMAAGLA